MFLRRWVFSVQDLKEEEGVEIMKEGKMWIGDIKLLPTLEHLP